MPGIFMGDGDDNVLTGGLGDDILLGLGGDDDLDGGAGADVMTGGSGDDAYVVDDVNDVVNEAFEDGLDTVTTFVDLPVLFDNVENLILRGAATVGNGNALANIITGNAHDNVLDGGLGGDTLIGGKGDDIYVVDSVDDVIVEIANQGFDVAFSSASYSIAGVSVAYLTLLEAPDAIDATGNDSANVLSGNALSNTLTGAGGNDVLRGMGGADIMIGGAGDDSYEIDDANDVMVEADGYGYDTAYASVSYVLQPGVWVNALVLQDGAGDIDATGNSGGNTLIGNEGANVLTGLGGVDILDGGLGADVMIGGRGADTYWVDDLGDVIVEKGNQGFDTAHIAVDGFVLGAGVSVNALILEDGDGLVTLTGNGLDNQITGNSEDNALFGLDGNDVLDGGRGADVMTGGLGDDTYYIDDACDVVVEDDNGGRDIAYSSVDYAIEEGSFLNDLTLTGWAVYGGGNDLANQLTGNCEDNELDGGRGDDTLIGADGDDYLFGGAGQDTLIGGRGSDILTGDAGADIFLYTALDNSCPCYGFDIITDLQSIDIIDLSAIDGDTTLAGDQAFQIVDEFSGAGQMIVLYDADLDATVYIADVDGDQVEDFVILMVGDQTGFTNFVL